MDNPGRLPGRGGLCFWVSVSPGLVCVALGRRLLLSGGTRRHGVCDSFPALMPRRKGWHVFPDQICVPLAGDTRLKLRAFVSLTLLSKASGIRFD